MFKSVTYNRFSIEDFGWYRYTLVDSDFRTVIQTNRSSREALAAALVSEYEMRNLLVAKNIALFYLSQSLFLGFSIDRTLGPDRNWIDMHHPTLKYSSKYYPCVVRQIKQLLFSKR